MNSNEKVDTVLLYNDDLHYKHDDFTNKVTHQ